MRHEASVARKCIERSASALSLWLFIIMQIHSSTVFASDGPYVDPNIVDEIRRRGKSDVIIVLKDLPNSRGDKESGSSGSSDYLSNKFGKSHNFHGVEGLESGTAVGTVAGEDAVKALKDDPNIGAILSNDADPPALIDTVRIIGARRHWIKGFAGKPSGKEDAYAVAVLDTGVEDDHPFLQGKVVAQACFSYSDEERGIESLCPAGEVLPSKEVVNVSANAAAGCKVVEDGCGHGTHVAGIIAGNSVSLPGQPSLVISGIAKDAAIVAIQVFSRFKKQEDCGIRPAPCVKSFRSSQLRALEWVRSLIIRRGVIGSGPNIVAVNMSLGGGRAVAPCDNTSPLSRPIQKLRQENVPTFVASGNDGYRNGVSQPGCVSAAITVGAVNKQSKLSSFTNRDAYGQMVKILAPGEDIESSEIGGRYDALSGTSMATPIVAGAYLVLKSAHPDLALESLEIALERSGKAVADSSSDKSYPVVNLARAELFIEGGKLEGVTAELEELGSSKYEANSLVSGHRFIISSAIANTGSQSLLYRIKEGSSLISQQLTTGYLSVNALSAHEITIETENSVDPAALEHILRDVAGEDIKVYVNQADDAVVPK